MEVPYNKYWYAKVFLLFHLRTEGNENIFGQFGFVQYFESTPPLRAEDNTLNCTSLCWATDGVLDHIFGARIKSTNKIEVKEGFGVFSFTSIVPVHFIVRSN